MRTDSIPNPLKLALLSLILLFTHPLLAQLEVLYENIEQDGLFRCIKEDYQENVLVSGGLFSDLTLGSITMSVADGKNFIAKFNPSNSTWTWANQITGNVWLDDLNTDASGNTFITGSYVGVATFDNITLTSTRYKQQGQWYDSRDIYVAKANANGAFVWAKTLGSNIGTDEADAVCTDASGYVYITGTYSSKSGFSCTKQDIYVAKLNSSGTTVWQKRITPGGCNSYGGGNDVTVDASGNVFFTGTFNGNYSFGAGMTVSSTTPDVFTSKLNSSGVVQWVSTGTGPGIDTGSKIYLDNAGSVYVGGEYSEHECCSEAVTFGSFTLPATIGDSDGFLVKYSASGALSWITHACTFTSYGEVTGVIPYDGAIAMCNNNLGLLMIDPDDGGVVDSLPLTGNFEGVPAHLYKILLSDFEPSASGYLMIGALKCDTVELANLTIAHSLCMDCVNWWDCRNDYSIIRSDNQVQLIDAPVLKNGSTSDENSILNVLTPHDEQESQELEVDSPADIPGFSYGGSYNGHYYYISQCLSTWEDADVVARDMGGYLATIASEGEHDFVTALAPNIYVDDYGDYFYGGAWIGLISYSLPPWFSGVCDYWGWWNGEELVYQNWANDPVPEPVNSNCGYAAVAGQCFGGYCTDNTDGWRTAFYRNDHKFYIVEFDENWNCTTDNNKTYVCHDGNTLCINSGSLQNHLDHGDILGPCSGCNNPENIIAIPIDAFFPEDNTVFEVFPNPAKDDIKIAHPVALTPGQLIMYDQLGNTLLTHEIAIGQRFTNLSLDTKRFVEGIYYVSGVLNGEVYTKKILIGDR